MAVSGAYWFVARLHFSLTLVVRSDSPLALLADARRPLVARLHSSLTLVVRSDSPLALLADACRPLVARLRMALWGIAAGGSS